MAYANAFAHNLDAIRTARRERLVRQTSTTRVVTIAPPPDISTNIWGDTEETIEQKYADLKSLTVAKYIQWLKANICRYGKSAEFGNGRKNAVEVFVKEVAGTEITFSASGEITLSGETVTLLSGWSDIAYYTYEDNGTFVTTFGKALKYAEWQAVEHPFIVSWDFQG